MSEELYCIIYSGNPGTASIGKKEELMKLADRNPGSQVCRIIPFYGKT